MSRPEEGPRTGSGEPGPDEEPTATLDGRAGDAGRRAARPRLARGASVGRYVVLGEVGAGGMGTVYAAYDPDLERRVALKLLHVPERRAAPPGELLREAQALARLSHPNVLTIYDAGAADGAVYLACELVDGVPLSAWLAEGPRSRREILRVFVAAGRGLAAAHAAGLVHRDFKPANVMVAGDGRVLVLDFGLARVSRPAPDGEGGVVALEDLDGAGPAADPATTAPGLRGAGTPAYMAPEQRAGGEAGPASDQYAFCVALAEALGGGRPGPDGSLDRPVAGSRRRVPKRLARAIERGLRHDPEERHPSLEALLAVLERDPRRTRRRIAAGALVGATALGAGLALHRATEERRLLCRGGEALMAEVWGPARRGALEGSFQASGSSFAAAGFLAASAAIDRYAAGWRDMHRSACEATRVAGDQSPELLDLRMACLEDRRQELDALLRLLGGEGVQPTEAVEAAQSLTPLSRCADARALLAPVPPPGPEAAEGVARLRRGLAEAIALERLGRYAEGVAAARELAAAAEPLAYWPLTAEILLRQGILEERGSDRQAAETLSRAVDAAVAGGDDRTAAEALVHLVRVHGYQLADHERARYYGGLAGAALARLGEPAELAADLADHLGRLAFQQGDHEEALTRHARALDLRRRALGEEHPEVGSTLLRLATVHAERGELVEAGRLTGRAVELYRAGYGEGHPRLAVGLVHLGDIEYRRGDFTAAEAAQRRAVAIREAALGADHVQTADVQLRLANTLHKAGRTGEAVELLARLRTVLEAGLGSDHPRMADVLSSLGSIHLEREEYRLAREHFEDALVLQERVYGAEHPWVATTVFNLGVVAQSAGEPALAHPRFERALALWESAYGGEHPLVGHAQSAVGHALLDLGRPSEAVAPLERALRLRQAEGTDPAVLASTRFTLARALAASGGDRARAGELAAAALDGYRGAGDDAGAAEVTAWLADQGGLR